MRVYSPMVEECRRCNIMREDEEMQMKRKAEVAQVEHEAFMAVDWPNGIHCEGCPYLPIGGGGSDAE